MTTVRTFTCPKTQVNFKADDPFAISLAKEIGLHPASSLADNTEIKAIKGWLSFDPDMFIITDQ